jgi:regulator of protease activity HflC (stomatin/prohibitin superfamily)
MASAKKPPGDDPLSRLLNDVGEQIQSRLKDWVAKQNGGKGSPTNNAGRSAPAPVSAASPKRSPGFGDSESVLQPVTPPSPISIGDTGWDTKLAGKWIVRAIFFILPVLAVIRYINSGKWQRNTDFRELNDINGYINALFGAFGDIMNGLLGSIVPLAIFIVGIILVAKSIRVVPQQRALVIERLGKFHAVLEPGLRFTIPFIDRISARHDLREVPLDVPPQVCITKDNTQLQVDGILYFQITDPRLATYGSSSPILAITQLAQTTLRSVIGKLELDKTFEERDTINHAVVNSLDAAAMNWGVKVLRYEIKDLTPPKEILHAMQAQITAEREKRALIAASEGRKQEQINIAVGQKEASIAKSEGNKIADINQAQGEAAAILAKAEANAEAIRKIASAIESQGGLQAVNLKVAEQYVAAFAEIAKAGNTIVVPQNLSDIAGLVTAATSVLKAQK